MIGQQFTGADPAKKRPGRTVQTLDIMKRLSATFIIFFVLFSNASVFAEDMLLGILEDVPGVYAGESHSTKVRVLFEHKNNEWEAFKSDCAIQTCLTTVTARYPKEVAWFVGFDGRKIGRVVARTPDAFQFYGHIGLQDIVEGSPPIVGKPSYEFAGFAGGEVRRPLVTNSKPDFKDPADWKQGMITPEIQKQAVNLLHSLVPAICKEGPSDDTTLVPFKFAQEDIAIRMYRSNDGRMLIKANVNGAYYCNFSGAGDGGFDAQTFVIDSNGKSRLLGPGLIFVDAGDYDADGKSELLFALSLYNRGGYVLFSDDFNEKARFEFGYH